ncbi:MAG: type I-C CRISPR-associated protein Cas8c/Csd1 [Sulfuritalea sp.]|nr:type I-C CRISPR-associated protein Cas8c/Csd1 [Sulfuritalea sp.]
MAWIEKLHATYEACKGREPPGAEPLMPISHAVQQAHIEITIDGAGNFKGARTYSEGGDSDSGVRGVGRPHLLEKPPHPLCDKVQYCAADYPRLRRGEALLFAGRGTTCFVEWVRASPIPKLGLCSPTSARERLSPIS